MSTGDRATLCSPTVMLILSNISMVGILATIGLIAWKLDGVDGLPEATWSMVLSPLVVSVICENVKFYSE